ncbi:MAG: hypothetical protein SNG10_01910 [Rikenellaceae bacterium]
MKKLLTFAVALVAMALSSASAQTINFNKSGEWWILPKFREMVSITTDESVSAKPVIKFNVTDFGEEKFVSTSSTKSLATKFSAGTYEMTVKVFFVKAPAGFNVNVKNRDGEGFKATYISTKGLDSGKWVEVTKSVELTDIDDAQIIVSLNNTPRCGVGEFYVDEVTFVKK